MVNVTEMWRAAGAPDNKKPYYWINQEQTQELIAEILNVSEIHSITESRKSGKEGQRGGGSTWYCEELALAYDMYLSPALHLACCAGQRGQRETHPTRDIGKARFVA
jgi:hypothetical protein